MAQFQQNSVIENIAWFRRWFDSTYYHKLYAHRDDAEAHRFIDALLAELQPPSNASIIDVGCGTGRHSKYLATKGFNVTGIDLAFSNIKQARQAESHLLTFHRHDMRIAFGNANFDYVFNFFTSFGYFNAKSEHSIVIRNMSKALVTGGMLVLDYINAFHAAQNLVPLERRETDGIAYNITRWADESHIYKQIAIADPNMPGESEHTEKIAKLTLEDFNTMFEAHGLRLEKVFGDYELTPYHANSPRMIMIAAKK
jgi:SAM-dependent methyltransferase